MFHKNNLKACHGFTYIEIMVAFMIFGLMLVFVARLGNSTYDLNRASGMRNRMVRLAEFELENYRTGINDIDEFISLTGFSLDDEDQEDGNVVYRELSASEVDEDFDVLIEESAINESVSEVIITVSYEDGSYSLLGQVIKDVEVEP